MTPAQKQLYRVRFEGMDRDEIMELLGEWANDCGCEAACDLSRLL